MSCCGKKRETLRQRRTIFALPQTPPAPTGPSTALIFTGTGDYLIAGRSSGEVYHFSSHQPEQSVDVKDAAAMLATGLFRTRS
jgi:hypothetical protein